VLDGQSSQVCVGCEISAGAQRREQLAKNLQMARAGMHDRGGRLIQPGSHQVKSCIDTDSARFHGLNVPDGPDSYLKLIKAVDRPAFGVHMDVCNGINSPTRFYHNAEFIGECFRTLGPWIASCHAKDLEWKVELNVHFAEVIPGRGSVNYAAYLREVSTLPVDAPLMLEHLKTAEEYDEGGKYIRKVAAEIGRTLA